MVGQPSATDLKAIELLRRAGTLPSGVYEKAVSQVRATGERSEEVLIQTNAYSEADLLKALSGIYRTHFVSTERLAKAEIPRSTLLTIPRKVAEKLGVFPVTFDMKAGVLGIVTADPEREEVLNEVRLVAGVKQVKPFVARPAAVAAAIAKYYGNDPVAFERLGQNTTSFVLDYGRQLNPDGTMSGHHGSVAPPADVVVPRLKDGPKSARGRRSSMELEAPEPMPARPGRPPPPVLAPPPLPTAQPAIAPPPPSLRPQLTSDAPSEVGHARMLPLVEGLVDLVDATRPDLGGHSAEVGRLLKRICEKLKVPQGEAEATVFAGLVHDLGKTEGHFTPLNVARAESHRARAAELYDAPLRILEAAKLSSEIRGIVAAMYERFDGSGLPRRLAGEAIPRGARLLAIVDSYIDLTHNKKNAFRRALSAGEALTVIEKARGTLFDGAMIEALKSVVSGQQSSVGVSGSVLLIDADPVALQERLTQDGLSVTAARSLASARELLMSKSFDMVVSEAALPDGDTLMFLTLARGERWGESQPWLFYTANQAVAQRAFDLSALDFIMKPADVNLVATKIRARLDTAPKRNKKGVSGSLKEMSLPDIVQVLVNGKKSGMLAINAGVSSGEVHFVEGAIVDAVQGDRRGAEAFYALAQLLDGDFALDPSFTPQGRTIHESGEALLLEAMRRLDEIP